MPEIDQEKMAEISKLRQALREQVRNGQQPDKEFVTRLTDLVKETGYADSLGTDPDQSSAPSEWKR